MHNAYSVFRTRTRNVFSFSIRVWSNFGCILFMQTLCLFLAAQRRETRHMLWVSLYTGGSVSQHYVSCQQTLNRRCTCLEHGAQVPWYARRGVPITLRQLTVFQPSTSHKCYDVLKLVAAGYPPKICCRHTFFLQWKKTGGQKSEKTNAVLNRFRGANICLFGWDGLDHCKLRLDKTR